MRLFASTLAVMLLTLLLAAQADAHLFRPGCNSKLAPRAELRCAKLNKQHALATITWARHQQREIAFYDASTALLLQHMIKNHRWLYRVSVSRMAQAEHRLILASFPPHHLLWLCISGGEGGIRSINPNGHYGMLQMHANWGYGTSIYASDDSQLTQEWAAEHAYKASHYSRAWLYGQWAADAHCF